MFRSLVQDICQKRRWNLPEYVTTKEGPDHRPSFTSTITVNGLSFQHSAPPSRTLKDSQNRAAELAFNHFHQSSPPSNSSLSLAPSSSSDMGNLSKGKLYEYCVKMKICPPTYSFEQEGLPHLRRFKCKVTIDGQTYESLEHFCTMKDAQNAAAHVALLSLDPDGALEDYKNLLKDLLLKEGLNLPVYVTEISGRACEPVFVCNVECNGQKFSGEEAKTKKKAEMNAAKVAYINLKKYKRDENDC